MPSLSPPPSRRIALVISSLGTGGAERVMSGMANYWAQAGWDVVLLTLAGPEIPPFYPLDPRVRLRPLDLLRPSAHPLEGLLNNLRRLWVLRRTLAAESPAAIIAFIDQTNVLTLLASRGLGIPVIVSERTFAGSHQLAPAWELLRRRLYPCAFAVVNQTRRGHDWFPPAVRAVGRVIPNHVETYAPGESAYDGPTLVAVGQMVWQKDFGTLLRAFAQIAARHPAWTLVIWGKGPERAALETLANELGLGARLRLPGVTTRPGGWIDGAGLFVLSSCAEGFPNVLLEAMHAGLPVVATDCETGPAELVVDGESGLLVSPRDPAALAAALDRMMGDDALRSRLAAAAPAATQAYAPDHVMAAWTALVEEAAAMGRKD